jgi:hypothetical protein
MNRTSILYLEEHNKRYEANEGAVVYVIAFTSCGIAIIALLTMATMFMIYEKKRKKLWK